MNFAQIHGVIERRLLVNFRADPKVVKKILPPKFKPQLVGGQAMVSICLIRFAGLRPRFMPSPLGLSSENAAHRFAVEWESPAGPRNGVYVHRRDTSLWLNTLIGGRIFPGVHHLARFDVRESEKDFYVGFKSKDDATEVIVDGGLTDELPKDSIFKNVQESSEFFKKGSVGYSPGFRENEYQGLKLITENWKVEPFAIKNVQSSFFEDKEKFPEGSITH